MVGIIGQVRAHGGIDHPLHADLGAGGGVGGHRLVHVRDAEEIDGAAAGAELHHAAGLVGLGLSIEMGKELRETLGRFFRIGKCAGGIVIRRAEIQVMAVELEAVESPVNQEHIHQVFRIFPGMRVHGRKVPAVPPGNIFVGAVLLHQQHFGMLRGQGAAGIRRHRRPPDLGLEARLVHGVRHPAHAFRADPVVGRPVTFADLVAIVDIDPLETEFHDLGQGADDLVHGERALVAPGAPDRLVGVLRRNGGFPTVGVVHIAGELPQRLEEVALAFDHELFQGEKRITGSHLHGLVELLADAGPGDVPLAGHRHGHELENRLSQSHTHARVLIP